MPYPSTARAQCATEIAYGGTEVGYGATHMLWGEGVWSYQAEEADKAARAVQAREREDALKAARL
eukprot:3934724-Rhodomonas_salina.1